jgi:hypothetical protein
MNLVMLLVKTVLKCCFLFFFNKLIFGVSDANANEAAVSITILIHSIYTGAITESLTVTVQIKQKVINEMVTVI